MKVIRMPPQSSEEAVLMNARIKAKKQNLINGKKPTSNAEWVHRSEHMIKWFNENPDIKNFLSYCIKHHFIWSDFKVWRTQSEVFSNAIDQCMQICLERREGFLKDVNELSKIYLKEQALYNPLLADYEEKMATIKKDIPLFSSTQPIIYQQVISETKEGKDFKAKQTKKDNK